MRAVNLLRLAVVLSLSFGSAGAARDLGDLAIPPERVPVWQRGVGVATAGAAQD